MPPVAPGCRGKFSADFWCLWSVGLITSTVRWLETVVVGVVMYRETDSPFLVSLVILLRASADGSERDARGREDHERLASHPAPT